jgi:hypothetical protein
MDPMGADAGVIKPFSWPPPKSPGKLEPYYGVPELNSATQGCELDGVPIPCDIRNALQEAGGITGIEKVYTNRGVQRIYHSYESRGLGLYIDYSYRIDKSGEQVRQRALVALPVPLQTTDELKAGFEELLKNPKCKEFVDRLINLAEGHVAEGLRLNLSFTQLAQSIGEQGGYVLDATLNLNGTPVSGIVDRGKTSIQTKNAQALIRTRSYYASDPPKERARSYASQQRSYLASAFHETFHHIGKVYDAYSDESLGRAAYEITSDKTLLPDAGNHDSLSWSSYWDNQLMKHCMPDLVRAGNPPQ